MGATKEEAKQLNLNHHDSFARARQRAVGTVYTLLHI